MEEREKFYSVNFSAKAREYADLESAKKAKGLLVVVESWVPFNNTAFGQTFTNANFIYKFLQGDELSDSVDVGPCRIISTSAYRTSRSGYNRDDIQVVFADANGALIKPEDCFGIRINGIESAVKFILDVGAFGDYEKYILHEENVRLKAKIAQLEDQLGENL